MAELKLYYPYQKKRKDGNLLMKYICDHKQYSNDRNNISTQYATDSIVLAGIINSSPIRCRNGLFMYTVKIPYASSDDMYINASLLTGYSKWSRNRYNLFFILTNKTIGMNSFVRIEGGRYIVADVSELVEAHELFNAAFKCDECKSMPNMPVEIYAIYANSIFVINEPNEDSKQFERIVVYKQFEKFPASWYEKNICISSCNEVFRFGGMHNAVDTKRPTYAYIAHGSREFKVIFSPQCKIPKNIKELSFIDLYGEIVILTKNIPIVCQRCNHSYRITSFEPLFIINNII